MRNIVVTGLFSLILIGLDCRAQTDTLSFVTPFSKGRSIVSLGGTVLSGTNDRPGALNETSKFSSSYAFDIKLGKVVVDNISLGLWFTTERDETNRIIHSELEMLTLGPYTSFYLGASKNGGFFLTAGALFINYYEKNTLAEPALIVDETVSGQGIAGLAGLGYTYVMKRRVGFEVGFNYRYAYINANIANNLLSQRESGKFKRADIFFKFGLALIFDPLKND